MKLKRWQRLRYKINIVSALKQVIDIDVIQLHNTYKSTYVYIHINMCNAKVRPCSVSSEIYEIHTILFSPLHMQLKFVDSFFYLYERMSS